VAQVVCDFCEAHLDNNKAAFADPRLELIIDDAKAQLEVLKAQFPVSISRMQMVVHFHDYVNSFMAVWASRILRRVWVCR
jgi:predicted membrane-bound spermidine synthase